MKKVFYYFTAAILAVASGLAAVSAQTANGGAELPASPLGKIVREMVEVINRGDDGEIVPAGVYLLRLRAAGVESVKKVVFRGRP